MQLTLTTKSFYVVSASLTNKTIWVAALAALCPRRPSRAFRALSFSSLKEVVARLVLRLEAHLALPRLFQVLPKNRKQQKWVNNDCHNIWPKMEESTPTRRHSVTATEPAFFRQLRAGGVGWRQFIMKVYGSLLHDLVLLHQSGVLKRLRLNLVLDEFLVLSTLHLAACLTHLPLRVDLVGQVHLQELLLLLAGLKVALDLIESLLGAEVRLVV